MGGTHAAYTTVHNFRKFFWASLPNSLPSFSLRTDTYGRRNFKNLRRRSARCSPPLQEAWRWRSTPKQTAAPPGSGCSPPLLLIPPELGVVQSYTWWQVQPPCC